MASKCGAKPHTSGHIFGELKMKTKRLITICVSVVLAATLASTAKAVNPVTWEFSLETYVVDVGVEK